MTSTTSRCPGHYFGFRLNYQCSNCQRLLTGYPSGYWYIKVPVFEYQCPQKLQKETE